MADFLKEPYSKQMTQIEMHKLYMEREKLHIDALQRQFVTALHGEAHKKPRDDEPDTNQVLDYYQLITGGA